MQVNDASVMSTLPRLVYADVDLADLDGQLVVFAIDAVLASHEAPRTWVSWGSTELGQAIQMPFGSDDEIT